MSVVTLESPKEMTVRSKRRRKGLWLLPLVPALLLCVFFFALPLMALVMDSLTVPVGKTTQVSFNNYADILTDEFYWEVLLRTIRISCSVTLATLIMAYPVALLLYFSTGLWRKAILFVTISPLFVSVIVRTYGWMILMSPNGVINQLLPASMKVQMLNTEGAVIVAMMHIYIPFMVLALNAIMVKLDPRLLFAAASLGASRRRIFIDIILPFSISGIVSGCVVVFSISMTAFSTPILIGGAARKTMAYLIYQQNLLLSNWHLGGALAIVLLTATVLIVRTFTFTAQRLNKNEVVA